MKSRCEIWLCALEDLGAQCSVSTVRDAITVVRRVEHEGDEFFTITLPKMARDLEEALSIGGIQSRLFDGWARSKMRVHIKGDEGTASKLRQFDGPPKLFGGFFQILFNTDLEMTQEEYECYENAQVHPLPLLRQTDEGVEIARMAYAIHAIRQLCLMFGKEKELCSDSAVDQAIINYVTLDKQLTDPLRTSEPTPFLRVVDSHWSGRF